MIGVETSSFVNTVTDEATVSTFILFMK